MVETETAPARTVQQAPARRKLARRDWVVLPAIALGTIVFLFGISEAVTRAVWPQVDQDSCFVNDPLAGYRFRANCTSRLKIAEGPWTTNHYNECGYRTTATCGPKPAGAVRVVLLGSSVAQGLFARYEDTFATRVEKSLSRDLKRPVEMENLGVFDSSPIYVYRRLPETLKLNPDVVVYVISPWDVEQKIDPEMLNHRDDPPSERFGRPAVSGDLGWRKEMQLGILHSRTVAIAQHYLFQNTNTFLRLYLGYGDKADFLRRPLSAAWQKRFENVDLLVGEMSQRLRAAHIPLVVIAVPSRAEAALLSYPTPWRGIDADQFGNEIARIAAAHGAHSVDLMSVFRRIPHSEQLFYVVDGHLTAEGHRVVAEAMTPTIEAAVENRVGQNQ